jgi:hypothetical protein
MARVAVTEQEVDRILQAPKIVTADVEWQPKAHRHWVGCELTVESQLKLTLHIYANANLKDRSKYSFALILSRNYRIASFESGSSHANRHTNGEKWLGEDHKHRWTELCRDSFAYTPTDMETQSVDSAFRSFCNEIGVDFRGQVEQLPAVQTNLGF